MTQWVLSSPIYFMLKELHPFCAHMVYFQGSFIDNFGKQAKRIYPLTVVITWLTFFKEPKGLVRWYLSNLFSLAIALAECLSFKDLKPAFNLIWGSFPYSSPSPFWKGERRLDTSRWFKSTKNKSTNQVSLSVLSTLIPDGCLTFHSSTVCLFYKYNLDGLRLGQYCFVHRGD